jgi:hypothetical protein
MKSSAIPFLSRPAQQFQTADASLIPCPKFFHDPIPKGRLSGADFHVSNDAVTPH